MKKYQLRRLCCFFFLCGPHQYVFDCKWPPKAVMHVNDSITGWFAILVAVAVSNIPQIFSQSTTLGHLRAAKPPMSSNHFPSFIATPDFIP
jgi:hypothetical protein